jgi:hypothetical protein
VLLADHSVWRKLRSQVFGADRRPKAQARCHPLLARYPLQVVLQQRWPYFHDRPYSGSCPLLPLCPSCIHPSSVSQDQEKTYLFVVELQKYALGELRDGAVCKDVYQKVVDKIQSDRPDLLQYFAKTAGFGMGLEFRDAAYPLSNKGTREVKTDMIFSLTLGFNQIPDGKKSTYALHPSCYNARAHPFLPQLRRLAHRHCSSRQDRRYGSLGGHEGEGRHHVLPRGRGEEALQVCWWT